jgi:hypothetical protein
MSGKDGEFTKVGIDAPTVKMAIVLNQQRKAIEGGALYAPAVKKARQADESFLTNGSGHLVPKQIACNDQDSQPNEPTYTHTGTTRWMAKCRIKLLAYS